MEPNGPVLEDFTLTYSSWIPLRIWQSPDGVLESIHHFFFGGNPAK